MGRSHTGRQVRWTALMPTMTRTGPIPAASRWRRRHRHPRARHCRLPTLLSTYQGGMVDSEGEDTAIASMRIHSATTTRHESQDNVRTSKPVGRKTKTTCVPASVVSLGGIRARAARLQGRLRTWRHRRTTIRIRRPPPGVMADEVREALGGVPYSRRATASSWPSRTRGRRCRGMAEALLEAEAGGMWAQTDRPPWTALRRPARDGGEIRRLGWGSCLPPLRDE